MCTQIVLDRRQTENLPLPESNRYLPNGVFLKAALLGYSQAGADLLWLQIVQVMGAKLVHVQDYNWLHQALDVVTTLDPQFVEAYDLGGVMLGELAGRPDWSNALLAKGIAANPRVWRLPFLQGFNYFFHLQQYAPAATALAQAARLPGSPSYVSELATRLFVQAHNPQAAVLFVDAMLEETANSQLRDSLERRKKEIVIEEHITMIERAVAKYRQRHDEPLTSLVPLVERGFLAAIPLEPFGGSYRFDSKTGTVVSTRIGNDFGSIVLPMHCQRRPGDSAMNRSELALNVVALSKTFRGGLGQSSLTALDRLHLAIPSGEIFGVLGPNGAGKSTIFRILMGLIRPSSGQAWVWNRPIGTTQSLQMVGYLPDQPAFYDYLTAEESLCFSCRLGGVAQNRLKARVEELLHLTGLHHVRTRRLRTFSKGMLQRIGIAQSLVHDPALLILDEPMSGLDPFGRREMRDLLLKLRHQGKTIVLSTHLLEDVQVLCDRVGILIQGRLVAIECVPDVLGRHFSHADHAIESPVSISPLDTLIARYVHEDERCAV